MPLYTTVSTKVVVSRIIRNCKLIDSTYADDIYEWINEKVDGLQIKWRLPRKAKEVDITAHTGELPCSLKAIDAVIYNGRRLRYGTTHLEVGVLSEQGCCNNQANLQEYFVSDPTSSAYKNQQSIELVRGIDIEAVQNNFDYNDFYYIQPGFIKTSFEEGCVVICYKEKKLDEYGLPLIPDIENAKESIFWYVFGKMILSGYKPADPSINYEFCEYRAEKYGRMAKNEIKALSKDEKESQIQMWVNLIPPQGYYSNFFLNAEQPKVSNITTV